MGQGVGRAVMHSLSGPAPMQSYQKRQACVAGAPGGQQEDEDSSDSEVADSPSSDERRIIESPPHRY